MFKHTLILALATSLAFTAVAQAKGKKGGDKKKDANTTTVNGNLVTLARDLSSITIQTSETGDYQPGRSSINRVVIPTSPQTTVQIDADKDKHLSDLRAGQHVQVKVSSDNVATEIKARNVDNDRRR
jgi:hypothetical protein